MKLGTKSLLFGLHQFILHPLVMVVAFRRIFGRMPDTAELFSIIVHDWGYFGKDGIDINGGELHPYLGAKISRFLFGERGWNLCIGHNDGARQDEGLKRSVIFAADKYYYVLLPTLIHRTLATLSGEYKELELGDGWDPEGFKKTLREAFVNGVNIGDYTVSS